MALSFLLNACERAVVDPVLFVYETATRHGGQVSGMNIRVFDMDGLLLDLSFGYANEAERLAVDADTVFKWGSITKQLVWISVLQLYEKGELDINADMRTYIPYDMLVNLKYPTSVYHLMTHSAGFLESDFPGFLELPVLFPAHIIHADMPYTVIEYFLKTIEMPQRFEPGEFSGEYSHYGVILASYIVEQVSGMPFYEYVHEHIFSRLDMAHSSILSDLSDNIWVAEQLKNQVCYLSADRRFAVACFPIAPPVYMIGGAISTAADFQKFALSLLPDDNGSSPLFESDETLFKLYAAFEYEYAAFTDHGSGIFALSGQMCHTATILLDINRNLGVIVMTNQENEGVFNRVSFLRDLLKHL